MSVGIGGAGIAGLALEVLAPPVQSAPTVSATGGTLVAGTYRYYVTATNSSGETTVSNEQSAVTTGSTSTVTVNWATVTNATGYKVYRTASGGATGTELFLASVGAVTSYLDTGALTPSGAFPTFNTAYQAGTYTAPTKFFPFNSESLTTPQATIWRRPIRQSVDIIGAVPGNFNVEGDFNMEALEDVILYFLRAGRASVTASALGGGNFQYIWTPTTAATSNITLSITLVRNGVVFGYTGCATSMFKFGISDGLLTFDVGIIGRDEAVQALPVPTWPTSTPFGAGMYDIEIPTGTAILDTDTFEWSVEDNGEAQFRLKSTGRGAQFIKYGERNATLTMERDFETRADYDAFKALTAQSITLKATRTANNLIYLNTPVSIKDTYEVGLSGQGDLVRASIAYQNIINSAGNSWQITMRSQENLGLI